LFWYSTLAIYQERVTPANCESNSVIVNFTRRTIFVVVTVIYLTMKIYVVKSYLGPKLT